jgi:hypothetical protein
MECAFQKDLSLTYELPEPCLLSCNEVVAESGYVVYLIVSIIVIAVLASMAGFAIYYSRMILPRLGENETLVDWLRGSTNDCDKTVRNNVLKGA